MNNLSKLGDRLPCHLLPFLVFGLTLLALTLLTPQFMAELNPPTGDEPYYLQMAHSLLQDHDFEMSNNYANRDYLRFYPSNTTSPEYRGWESFPWRLPPHQSRTLRPGLYEKHGIGLPILIAPAYWAGGREGTVWFMNILAALLAANIFLLAREFTGGLKASLLAWLGLSFTSPLLSYSFLIFPAIPAALLVIYAFRRIRLSPHNNPLQLAGAALAIAFLPWLHAGYLLLSLPLFIYAVTQYRRAKSFLFTFLPPIVISGSAFGYYYYYLYGTIVPNYQDHAGFSGPLGTLGGLLGFLFDQQWGLLVYSPLYLLALAGLVLMVRSHRKDLGWLLAVAGPTLLLFASYRQWWGEWCPPARYLVPILGLGAAPLALALKGVTQRWAAALAGLLFGASLFIMGSFVLAPKLMYNHPTGVSRLFQSYAQASLNYPWGLDLTRWLPSFVVPGGATWWQAALALGLAGMVVAALSGIFRARPRPDLARLATLGRWGLSRSGLIVLLLGLVLLLGAYFRLVGLNWDAGQHLHPDERFITMVATDIRLPASLQQYLDSATSPLSPYNRGYQSYAYGTSFLFLTKFLGVLTGQDGYDHIYLLGRLLSALFDLGTVGLVFLLGRRLYGPAIGLLGAFLYSVAVLAIQHAHFFVAESFTTFFVVLALYGAVRVWQEAGWLDYAAMGLASGLALASKISVAFLVPMMVLAVALALSARRSSWLRAALGLGIALTGTLLAFRLAQPYAFAGSGLLDLRLAPQFLSDIETQRRIAAGSLEMPYTLQWAGTTPYLYQLKNLVLWGLGPALGLAALAGVGLALAQIYKGRHLEHLLPLVWVMLLFLYYGGQLAKFMRYLLPIYPALALLAAFLLVWLWRAGRARAASLGVLAGLAVLVVVLGSLLWAFAFTRIYTRPLTRLEASQWIYQNVPTGAVVANEHWDDPLPLPLPGHNPGRYRALSLELYNDDNAAKRRTLIQQLDQTDYIFLSSNRLYGSIPRLPLRYPMTREYYRLLFAGRLGFERVATFTSYPNLLGLEIKDDAAEEAFTVYDHPKVIIFKKGPAFSRQRVQDLLSSVSLEEVIRQSPKEAVYNGLLMPPDLRRANQEGGTWSRIFDPQGLPSRFPALTWYLLVQLLSLAVLPLGLVALWGLPDRGYPLLKALGLLIVAYFSWLAASLRLAPFTRQTILGALLLVVVLSGLVFWRQRQEIGAFLRERWRLVLVVELLFLAAFVAFYLIRLANPDLWHPWRGGEKPMDLAYLNAVTKSTYFPPYDPWFSGGYINYYYFGQVLVATLVRLTGIPTAISYNLAVPLLFALTAIGAFSVGYNLVSMSRSSRRLLSWPLLGGLAATTFVAVAGNLDGLFQKVQGLWAINPQPWSSPWPGMAGLVNAWLGLQAALAGKELPVFDFWRSSRMMAPTFSITEFPFFTFLFADLHPHLIALPYTLLALGFILALSQRSEGARLGWLLQAFFTALALGSLWTINSWDFPTYFLLAAVVLLLARQGRNWEGWPSLARWGLMVAGLFLACYLLYYPFHHYYQQFYAGVNPSPEKTPLHQYWGIHGLFLLILLSYLLSRLWTAFKGISLARAAPILLPGGAVLAVALVFLVRNGLHLAAFLTLVMAMTLALLAWEMLRRPVGPGRLMVLLLISGALLLGIGVEFATIQEDIQRMNTVFKFYLQAWVLMGVASAYCLVSLARDWGSHPRRWLALPWSLAFAITLWAALLYPFSATPVRVQDRFTPLPPTDDGMAYMRVAKYRDERGAADLLWDYRGIRWLQENVPGSPVVLEAVTPLYHWGSRISIYTGLPTVIGWDWHQKQQRGHYHDMIERRLSDVRTMYSTPDIPTLLRLLYKYNVSYIYVGELERNYYPAAGLAKFEALAREGRILRLAYQEGPVSIYQVVGANSLQSLGQESPSTIRTSTTIPP
jgi:YYY domain-containing protein